jgi:uncharacterized membrane protein YjdF
MTVLAGGDDVCGTRGDQWRSDRGWFHLVRQALGTLCNLSIHLGAAENPYKLTDGLLSTPL